MNNNFTSHYGECITSDDIERMVQNNLKNCLVLSLALDKCTDNQDNPQLVMLVHISADTAVKEDMSDFVVLEGTWGVAILKKCT
jgi:hypothetical protein